MQPTPVVARPISRLAAHSWASRLMANVLLSLVPPFAGLGAQVPLDLRKMPNFIPFGVILE